MSTGLKEKLEEISGRDGVKVDESLKEHTSMKVGGAAAYYVSPRSEDEIRKIIELLNKENEDWFVLGNGSNVIVSDAGYKGTVICLKDNYKGAEIERKDDRVFVRVKAGTLNKDLSEFLCENSIGGFEFASGIPGTIGGAVFMNAGAYGGEMKNIVREVKLLDKNGRTVIKTGEEMEFSYRHSFISDGGFVALEAVLELKNADKDAVRAEIDELTRQRQEKQPLEYPSCGSTFKRPEGYFAGKLISDAGLKGFSIGDAQVSEKHSGFVINKGQASSEDILKLIDYIKEKVYESQGVMLSCEVKVLQ